MSLAETYAFPSSVSKENLTSGELIVTYHLGMTLREYYIGQALAGYCANYYNVSCADKARGAIEQADAVLALLDKEETK